MPASHPVKILHLSDTHLFGDHTLHYGRVNTLAALRRTLEQLDGVGPLDLVVASGDLSDDGSVVSYERIKATLEPWATAHHARVVYAMGNHDRRESFQQVLGSGHGSTIDAADHPPIDAVSFLGPWRIVTLDSSVPGAGYGELGTDQLEWLTGVLAQPYAAGSIIVIHHPPIRASTALLQALELYNPGDMADIVRNSDTRVILSGHFHHPVQEVFATVPVIVTPGIANTTDVLATEGTQRAVVGSGGTLITLCDDRLRSIPLRIYSGRDGDEIFHIDAKTVEQVAQQAGRVDTR